MEKSFWILQMPGFFIYEIQCQLASRLSASCPVTKGNNMAAALVPLIYLASSILPIHKEVLSKEVNNNKCLIVI